MFNYILTTLRNWFTHTTPEVSDVVLDQTEEYADNFEHYVPRALLDLMRISEHICVAGGAVVRSRLNRWYPGKHDIDVFCIRAQEYEIACALLQADGWVGDLKYKTADYGHKTSARKVWTKHKIVIDLVLKADCDNIEALLNGFDINMCGVAWRPFLTWDSQQMYYSQSYKLGQYMHKVWITNHRATSEERVTKYVELLGDEWSALKPGECAPDDRVAETLPEDYYAL